MRYVENKSIYSDDFIKILFQDQIKERDINKPQFYSNEYYFHFTDAESAFLVLSNGTIYPYAMKTKPGVFGSEKFVYFLDLFMLCDTDMSLNSYIFDYELEMENNDFNSNFHKL